MWFRNDESVCCQVNQNNAIKDVQASIGGVQSKALEVEDGATKPDLPLSLIVSDAGCNRECYRVRYKVLVLAFACLLAVANSKLVESPNNTVMLKEESTNAINLACRSDFGYRVVWFLNNNQVSEKEELYNGYYLRQDVKPYCTVKTDENGKCYLNLTNTAEAAQTYICLEPGTLAEVSADVIWLGHRSCYDSSTEDLVNLTCIIEFRGNWAPTMEWKEHGSHGDRVLSVGVNTATVANQHVTSTLVMPLEKGSMNYSCTTNFDIRGKPRNTTATNIPDYNQVWTSSVVIKPEDKMAAGAKAGIGIGSAIIIALAFCIVCFIHAKPRKEEKKNKKGIKKFQLLDCLQIKKVKNSPSPQMEELRHTEMN